MKRKYADLRINPWVKTSEFKIEKVNTINFKGIICLNEINEINEKKMTLKPDNTTQSIIGIGYKWISIFQESKKYCVTAIYDEEWNLLQWYFDIAKDTYKCESNIPYIDDLYLDIIAFPDGQYYVKDEEELEDALSKKLLSKEEYNRAYTIAEEIFEKLDNEFDELVKITQRCMEIFK